MSFLENLKWRYAAKKFDEAKSVSEEDLKKILEAIRFAPSSYGIQPFHVTVVSNNELKTKLAGAAFGQKQVSTASYVLVFSARTDIASRGREYINLIPESNHKYVSSIKNYLFINWVKQLVTFNVKAWSTAQAAIALGFAMAAAAELKIDSCPMEGFVSFKVRKVLSLSGHLKPVFLLPIGYRAGDEAVREKIRFSEKDLFDFR